MRKNIRVLVVDRHSQSCKAIAKAVIPESRIEILGFSANGYESITQAITLMPDIVYMNLALESEMAAVFACREIKANLPSVGVVLYGKEVNSDIIFRAFQMGAENVLVGDYSNREFIDALLDAFDGKSNIHHSVAALMRKEFMRILDLNDNMVYVLNVLVKLTVTEINIIRHFNNGMSSQEICKILFIANSTMKTHISHILKKFNLESMTQVVQATRSTELFSMINPYFDVL